ncbi:MAG: hypothetical protein K2P94_10805 [Rhodospirillaceae bacterium]|nr:hypothetical protein [Rhodospirillaceae bacterium]
MKKNSKATLAEAYYCTIDDALPATVAVTFRAHASGFKAQVSTTCQNHCEEMLHAVIHPASTQAVVLEELELLHRHITAYGHDDLTSCFLQVISGAVMEAGGHLHLDEDWPHYFLTGQGQDISRKDFPAGRVLIAISAPMTREQACGHLSELIVTIQSNGLSCGQSITPRGIGHTVEIGGKFKTEILSRSGYLVSR